MGVDKIGLVQQRIRVSEDAATAGMGAHLVGRASCVVGAGAEKVVQPRSNQEWLHRLQEPTYVLTPQDLRIAESFVGDFEKVIGQTSTLPRKPIYLASVLSPVQFELFHAQSLALFNAIAAELVAHQSRVK